MDDDLLDGNDATGIADAIRAGDVSAREVVAHAIARIEERNPAINAVTEQRIDAALAEVADGPPPGALGGVPFVVKDLGADVAGMRSTGGSRLQADVVATADSAVVARYRAAGVVVVGMTNAPEWGRNASTEPVLHGPTRNPYRLSHSAGGSSGGSAAAVAAGMVPVAHGNDGGGSIRIPASACGLVGLKPTRARTPNAPRRTAFAYPVAVNHVLARSVRDSALLLDVATGPVSGDPYVTPPPARPYVEEVGAPPGRCRVALSTAMPNGTASHDACASAATGTAKLLASLGHDVEEATPPYPVDALRLVMTTVMAVPMATEIDQRLAELGRELRDDDLEPFTRVLYDVALGTSGRDVVRGLQALEDAGHALGPFFERYDVLVTPTMPVPVPRLGVLDTTDVDAMYRNAAPYASLTSFCNATGQPAISLPAGLDGDGLPVGVQLAAAYGREDLLIRLAAQLEAARPWPTAPVWPPRDSRQRAGW